MTDIFAGITLFTIVVMTLVLMVLAARGLILRRTPVRVSVNDLEPFTAATGQKLLDVLHGHDVLVPSACAGAGTCGLCRVTVPVGGGPPLPIEAARLNRSELRRHMRLACQVTLRRDTEVRVSADLLGLESWECPVVSTRMLAPFIREIVLQLPPDATPDLRAGSYVQVTAPPHAIRFSDFRIEEKYADGWARSTVRDLSSASRTPTSRAYSIANRPEDRGKIVLNVRLALPPPAQPDAPPGLVSSFLFGLEPGDVVSIAGPYGDFAAQDTGREMVIIGGGVGMAPLRSIIHDQLERVGAERKVTFWYGARSRIELFYDAEFDALQERHANFDWTVALSDPQPGDDWDGPVGFIHDVVYQQYLKDHPAPGDCEYYLCGPPLMIRAVMAMLTDIGADPDSIFNDNFGSTS